MPKNDPLRPAMTFRECITMRAYEFPQLPLGILYKAVSEVHAALMKARATAKVEVKNKRARGDIKG